MIAFYAAVHAVNVYLWETQRHDPGSHADRRNAIQSSLPLRRCFRSYRPLSDVGFYARYNETYTVSEQHARTMLELNFRQVEAIVMQALGQPAPIW